jgi:hypothetical protein
MDSGQIKETIVAVLEKWSLISEGNYALVGLDGFIDKIQHPVQHQDQSGSTFYSSLDQFGQRIREAAGQSAQVELHTNTIKLGGNAPIFANALACLGIPNTCLGTFGYPQIHPVFQEIHEDCDMVSLGMAAETNALEFDDGKLILSELSTFQNLDWAWVKNHLDFDQLVQKVSDSKLIALVDWCNLPHATDIWTGFFHEIVQTSIIGKPHFFFDLADPTKKSDEEINLVTSIINRFSDYGQVTFGLNVNEATKLAQFFARQTGNAIEGDNLKELGSFLYQHMSIDQLLIHPLDGCMMIDAVGYSYLDGRVVKKPVVSTGGGDNFNAGFCFGLLNGFNKEESMVLAMATSGAYVQHGTSPTQEELNKYLVNWMEEAGS